MDPPDLVLLDVGRLRLDLLASAEGGVLQARIAFDVAVQRVAEEFLERLAVRGDVVVAGPVLVAGVAARHGVGEILQEDLPHGDAAGVHAVQEVLHLPLDVVGEVGDRAGMLAPVLARNGPVTRRLAVGVDAAAIDQVDAPVLAFGEPGALGIRARTLRFRERRRDVGQGVRVLDGRAPRHELARHDLDHVVRPGADAAFARQRSQKRLGIARPGLFVGAGGRLVVRYDPLAAPVATVQVGVLVSGDDAEAVAQRPDVAGGRRRLGDGLALSAHWSPPRGGPLR